MARKFLTAIDLAQNELQNARVQNIASAPGSPVKGQLYFDSTTNILYWYSGTAWVPAQGGVVSYGTITAETSFGASKADGVATTLARSDHAHGNPTHLAADHSTIPINALAGATGPIDMNGFKITEVGDPTAATDAANKQYVDNSIAGLSWKDSVRVASTATVNLTGVINIDGVALVNLDRILIKNQTNPAQNGIYTWFVSDGSCMRTLDANTGAEMLQATVYVEEGTTQADTAWTCTTNAPITLDTTGLTWVQFAGGGTVTAGAGMTQSGNTLNVIGDATITVGADSIGQAAMTGDVTTVAGSNASTIAGGVVSNAKLAQMPSMTIKGNNDVPGIPVDLTTTQVRAMFAGVLVRIQTVGVGATTPYVFNHNLNTRALSVTVWHSSAPYDEVDCDIEHTDLNNVTLRFAVAPGPAEYTCTVMG